MGYDTTATTAAGSWFHQPDGRGYEAKAGILNADIKTTDPMAGTFEAILSAPTLDRDGEVIDARAFHPLPDHIPIDIDHGMSTASIVGSGTPYYDGDTLMFRGSFASTALGQEVRTLVTEGHVRKMSVAFRQAVREVDEKTGQTHIRSGELLNAAIVPIPSNREASILVAKALGADRLEALVGADIAAAIKEYIASKPGYDKSPAEDTEPAAAPAAAVLPPRSAKAMAVLAEATLLLNQ